MSSQAVSPPPPLDAWMPTYVACEYHERYVERPPPVVDTAVRTADLGSSPVVRLLFGARGLVRRGRRYTVHSFVDAGFVLLQDEPGTELVLGLTGRFWRPTGKLVSVQADRFTSFSEPGYVQAAWNFRVVPDGTGSRLSTETRVRATDEAAQRSFLRYWRVVGPFSGLIRTRMLATIDRHARTNTGS